EDIRIENVQGSGISSRFGCSVTGLPNRLVRNVMLKNINLTFEGGGTVADAERVIPELEKSYPSGKMFGTLPAYGFYMRHVRNVTLEGVRLAVRTEDHRPAVFCDDVAFLEIKGLKAAGSLQAPGLIRLHNTKEAVISECYPTSAVGVF